MIYLDNNATTQVHPEVREAMLPYLEGSYGNPSGGYRFGKESRDAVEAARERVAELAGAKAEEVVFTSCGTESNNSAFYSAMETYPERKHLVSTRAEHSAVVNLVEYLEAKHGYEVDWVPVDGEGLVDVEAIRRVVRPGETALVSIMWANNETGVLGPVEEAAGICEEAGVLFHTDAVQAVGKVPVSMRESGAHFLSVSGHKMHASKGVGALLVSERVRFQATLIGGGQEKGRRSGTENVAGIVGMGKAAELMGQALAAGIEERVRGMRDRFEAGVLEAVEGTAVNGDRERRLPNTSNLYFEGVDAEGLLILLDDAGVCCSPGSACSTGSFEPSRVIMAMGHDKERGRSSVRFSLSSFSTAGEVDEAVGLVTGAAGKLRVARPRGAGRVVGGKRG
ncbi:MAG: aminotransferase class V-fold PLP-dependent enzyme [Verrucomicrobiota bacterium]